MPTAARTAVVDCHEFVTRKASSGEPIYGITTGYGALVEHAGNEDPPRTRPGTHRLPHRRAR
ncbi:aromatic amino acid lyase [Kribbella sp. CA-294648]|uniref:aromatic amino acid lyase n=1 Tax=Kribbella sp. CA-294648 TaxID=3239948 RepID=UPI003D8BD814